MTNDTQKSSGAPSPIELTAPTASRWLPELYRRSHEQAWRPKRFRDDHCAITISGSWRKDDQREAADLLPTLSAPRDEIDTTCARAGGGLRAGLPSAERTERNCPFDARRSADSLRPRRPDRPEVIERIFATGAGAARRTTTHWSSTAESSWSPHRHPLGRQPRAAARRLARGAVGYISTADVVVIRQTRAEPAAVIEVRPDKDGFAARDHRRLRARSGGRA